METQSKSETDNNVVELYNGFKNPSLENSDIEIAMQSVSYTSLKDLLPVSPPTNLSPTNHNSSWNEITIRNPLVKQAALAYLQPMSSPPEIGNKGFFQRLKDAVCCRECGCFAWLNDVVLMAIREAFWVRRRVKVD